MSAPHYAQGPPGASLLTGIGAPATGLGTNGDMYVDSGPSSGTKGNLYSKAAGAWVLKGNVSGPQGIQGVPGPFGSLTNFRGVWNPTTNTPTLANGTGAQNDAWVASVLGSHDFGAGSISFNAGDSVVYNGSVWVRVAVDLVSSTGQIIPHGTNAGYVRPPGLVVGNWVGPVQPTNANENDVWDDTSGIKPTILTTSLTVMNSGVPVTQQLVVDGTQNITWTPTAGIYPSGISVSSDGILSGIPTAAGAYDFTMTATNGFGTDVAHYVSTIGAAVAPTIVTTSLGGTPTAGTPYSQTILVTGSVPITLAVISGSLPAGLSLSGITISGTPTTAGTYTSFDLRATNTTTGLYDDQTFSGSIAGSPPIVTTTILDPMSQGAAFSQTPLVIGTATITFSTTGTVPAGLSVNGTTGAITGTPTGTGPYSFHYIAHNAYSPDSDVIFSGTIAPGIPVITTTNAVLGTLYRNVPISVTPVFTGATPVTWTHSGTFPAGVSFNDSTGLLSGSPTTTGGSYNFTLTATNSYGADSETYSGVVAESNAVFTETSLNTLTNGTAFTPQTLHATGYGPLTWSSSAVAGTIPAGMTWNAATQTLSGTPTGTGPYSFTLRITNGIGVTTDQVYAASIVSPPVAYGHQGTFATGAGTAWSASGPNITTEKAVTVYAAYVNASGTASSTLTGTYNGVGMTYKGQIAYNVSGAGMYIAAFTTQAIDHPGGVLPGGVKTIAIASTLNVNWRIQSESYDNVVSIGAIVTNSGSASPTSLSIPSTANNMVSGVIASYQTSAGAQTAVSGTTQRDNQSGALNIWYQTFFVADKVSVGTPTVLSSTLGNTGSWAACGVDLKTS